MGDRTKIEWTDSTWSPVTGCTKVSPGCDHCYAEAIAHRFAGTAAYPNGFDVTLHPDRLYAPLRWTKPRRVFVNSMSDLFHKDIPDDYIAQVFAVMSMAHQHTFQVLTKRPGRMRSLLNSPEFADLARGALMDLAAHCSRMEPLFPLPNVWLGVSVEDQKWADVRIPVLLDTPAAVRFISAEPLLGPVDLDHVVGWTKMTGAPSSRSVLKAACSKCDGWGTDCGLDDYHFVSNTTGSPAEPVLDWVIVGGESGPGARPMHPDWAKSLRDQCVSAGVRYLFKQWGAWAPSLGRSEKQILFGPDGSMKDGNPPYLPAGWTNVERVGKKLAGRELDGRTWDEYPVGAR